MTVDDDLERDCAACRAGRHSGCTGWTTGWCGCGAGLCWLRLLTGVMWDIDKGDSDE